MPLSTSELLHQLQWRYAVKKFDSTRKISATNWQVLEDALVLTPSSYGLQPWQFLMVQNLGLRQKLKSASWNQAQVEDCSHFVVFAALQSLDEAYIDRFADYTASVRHVPVEKIQGYIQMMKGDLIKGPRSREIHEWATRQAYIALGNLMTSAAVLGIDTCPMEGIEPVKYDEILQLNTTPYRTVVACAVGYRHADDAYAKAAKVRFPKDQILRTLS